MPGKYADVSQKDIFSLPFVLASLVVVLLWTTLKYFSHLYLPSWLLSTSGLLGASRQDGKTRRRKTWRRTLGDTTFRFLTANMNWHQIQYVLGTTLDVYRRWTRQTGLEMSVEELGGDARLLWIGPRRTQRVVLYFHGGGYLLPLSDFAASFWYYVQKELDRENIHVGFAILNYSIMPTAKFPTQLSQAASALNYCLTTLRVPPSNIQITGDSAGGNLALALVSHILHPLPGVPRVDLSGPLNGVYLMSPWFCLEADQKTLSKNGTDKSDSVSVPTYMFCAQTVLQHLDHEQGKPSGTGKGANGTGVTVYPYLIATTTSETWFQGLELVASRVLVTAGSAECLAGETVKVAEKLKKGHARGEKGVKVVVQEGGVHNDPFFDFLAGEKKERSELTPVIVDWVRRGFQES